jgi:hypothetical protein
MTYEADIFTTEAPSFDKDVFSSPTGPGKGVIPTGGYPQGPKAVSPVIDTSSASLWDKIRGGGEAARYLANALISSPLSVPIATLRELSGNDQFGKIALQKLIPQPQTPVGQEYAQNVNSVMQQAVPLTGLTAEMAALNALGPAALDQAKNATITRPLERSAQRLMNSALKPRLSEHTAGDAKIAVDTLLQRGINPTKGGAEKLKVMINDLNDRIAERVSSSNAMIPRDAVAAKLDDVRSVFSNQAAPADDLSAINKIAGEWAQRPENIPVQTAQALKQGTYRILNKKYGEQGSASVEAQKGLARGLKEGIADAVPEVVGLNAEESALLKTLSIAERRAFLDLDRNILGISPLVHNPAMWAAYMSDKSTLFKSLAARALHKLAGSPESGLLGPKPAPKVGLLTPDVTEIPMSEVKGLFANNASGESAASLEALGRMKSEQAKGQTRVMANQDGSNITPLIGPTAVDQQAGKGQVVAQRNVGTGEWTILSRGEGVTESMIARILAMLKKRDK